MVVPQRFKQNLPYNPAIPGSQIYTFGSVSKGDEVTTQRDICNPMSLQYYSQQQKYGNLGVLSIYKWTKKIWHMHMTEYYSAIKKSWW